MREPQKRTITSLALDGKVELRPTLPVGISELDVPAALRDPQIARAASSCGFG